MRNPGVQNPHWNPWLSHIASWSGFRTPSSASPSIVVISAPRTCTANVRHDRAASPSMSTVQAPQTPCSQPMCVPVSPRSSRSTSASVFRGSTVAEYEAPVDRQLDIHGRRSSALLRLPGCAAPGLGAPGHVPGGCGRRSCREGPTAGRGIRRPGRPPLRRWPSGARPRRAPAPPPCRRSGVSETPMRTMRASTMRASLGARAAAAAPTMAKSPCRRVASSKATPVPG